MRFFVTLPPSFVDLDPYPDPNWIRIQWGPWIRIQERAKMAQINGSVNKYHLFEVLDVPF
jgi:hypothetical protein